MNTSYTQKFSDEIFRKKQEKVQEVQRDSEYIDFCEKEDMDPDCYTSALRWIENRDK